MRRVVWNKLDWSTWQSKIVVFAALTFGFTMYASICVKPHHDGLGILSTGVNLLRHGRYAEYYLPYSHRGPLGALVNGLAYLITGDIEWGHNITVGVAAAMLAFGLARLTRLLGMRGVAFTVALFAAFPFFPYAMNSSAIHVMQSASVIWAIAAVISLRQEMSLRGAVLLGLFLGLGGLVHPINYIIGVIALLFVGAVGLQTLLVWHTSGIVGISAESFQVSSTWNLIHPPSPLPTPSPTYESLTGEPAPQSLHSTVGLFLAHPGVYITYFANLP